MIKIDGSLIMQIINFLFLIWILNILFYRPIRGIIKQRQERISGLETNIETAEKDVTDKEVSYAKGIKEARAKGMKEKESLIAAATEEEQAIVEKINQKGQQDLAEVREKVTKETESARAALGQEIDAFANMIGEKILGRAVS